MKVKAQTSVKNPGGFTLVEMIGVLAIIAILTSLLIPKIFQVINDAKISNALVTYNTAKAAASALYGKYGGFFVYDSSSQSFRAPTSSDFASSVDEDYDQDLIKAGYLEAPFQVKIGNGLQGSGNGGARLRLVDISTVKTTDDVSFTTPGTYSLSSASTTTNGVPKVDVTGTYLVEAVIPGVAVEDARALNQRIDGTDAGLGEQTYTGGTGGDKTGDYTGRCKWQATSGAATVYLYVAHR